MTEPIQATDPGQRCPALAYTNDPTRLVVRCQFPAGHGGSHLEAPRDSGDLVEK